MRLLVGLGNPGSGYANNRHNLGFMTVDRIVERHGLGTWRTKFQGHFAQGQLGGDNVVLLKPMTFMNESGRAVSEAMSFYKLDLEDVIVFYDEIELAPGKIRVRKGGGHAGHNGIRSLVSHIGEAFWRTRMGVGHPGNKDRVSGYVLQDFAKADSTWVTALVDAATDATPLLIEGEDNRFMTDVAQAMQGIETPPSPRDVKADKKEG
ncbi:MAG: aminoacyl-tRNA hydrolase [Rhodospirillaceae bacterium]|jgi:peptidyl-tRNA hydrolase, PTH1 family|nr:aminoacyl-tRNA hydrolase [Rhodospirillaceae bacterium]MBT5241150.1 aminoacyl-tRNA hydrolase [Rhodospirillaceae bacterium]MBT5565662.1 aminoacyl-tRNA hydrolase [Rhodospirillaceae bacterium]MBT6090868.1 aminoacyl-tRNA hydrolase [Rhodospirillaceae bacterium]MBT6960143.1 aminoacyl-tRNA hydrolase [Rhodospirillaceae bacterium]